MRTVVIAQARMGSSRLPGKVLLDLAGRTVLAHVLARAAAMKHAVAVCCATSDLAEDDAVAAAAEREGATVFRGSATDVLSRYSGAARAMRADVVVRITCDCPLIDPEVCDAVVALRATKAADYACNNMPPSWPHGLDCEAFTADCLFSAERQARSAYEREHVTPWIRQAVELRRVNLPGPTGVSGEQRWTLDYPEDLDFMRALFAGAPQSLAGAGWRDVWAEIKRRPELSAINYRHRDPARIIQAPSES